MVEHWWQSKTKVGSLLLGGGMVSSAVGSYVLGQADLATMIKGVATGFSIILVGFGLRDAIRDLEA